MIFRPVDLLLHKLSNVATHTLYRTLTFLAKRQPELLLTLREYYASYYYEHK